MWSLHFDSHTILHIRSFKKEDPRTVTIKRDENFSPEFLHKPNNVERWLKYGTIISDFQMYTSPVKRTEYLQPKPTVNLRKYE